MELKHEVKSESSDSEDDAESVEETDKMDAEDIAMDMGLSCVVCR